MNNKSIYVKLLEVQKEINPIKKTEKNPFFNSMYFDVNAILEQLKPILSKHGLVLTQAFGVKDNNNLLVTVVVDSETGDAFQSEVLLPVVIDPQKFGSAVTYYRRYALQSLFALQAEDDDANQVSRATPKSYKKPKFKPQDYSGEEAFDIES